MKDRDFNDKPISTSKNSSGYLQRRFNSLDFYGQKTETAVNGVGLPAALIFFTARTGRVRASTIFALLHCYAHSDGGSRDLNERDVTVRCSNEFWFVKVVCTLLTRSSYFSDVCSGYLCERLNPLISFEVVKQLNDPKWGLKFLEFSRTSLSLSHLLRTYDFVMRSLCEVGLHDSAKVVFDYMRSDGHLLNSQMIEFFVMSCVRAGKCDVVKVFLSQFWPGEVTMNTIVYNNLLNALVKQNKVDEAVNMFEEHFRLYSQPDAWTFNILIRGLCRKGEINKAFDFFNDIGGFGCSPDIVTYNTLINGLCRSGDVVRGHDLLKEVKFKRDFSLDVMTYTSVISGYCKLGKMEEASSLYDEMNSCGIKPSVVTFNVLIDGFGKVGNMIAAEYMRESMLYLGYLPDVVTFSSLIDGYSRNGQLNQGLKLLDEMNAINMPPNVYTFAILINAMCKENKLNEARRFLKELKWIDVIPKSFIYNPVIDGFCKAGNVDEANVIVAEMEEKGCKPDKVTFTILIIGHCRKGRMVEAITIFNKMLRTGCAPDGFTVNSLTSCLLKAGMPNEAFRIKQRAAEDLNIGFPSLKKAIHSSTNTDIPVAA